jgi:hypothetical protein
MHHTVYARPLDPSDKGKVCRSINTLHVLTTMRRIALISALLLGVACDEGDVTTGFVAGPQPASRLTMLQQPSNVVAFNAISPPVRVEIRNNAGQVVTTSTLPVTMSITPNTGTPGATLSGQLIVNAENGVATFNNLRINQPGTGYTLTASASGLTSVVTAPFDVTP